MKGKRTYLLASVAMAAAFAGVAQAQDDAAPQSDTQEIIVTAQKRAQSLQDVSVSISAMGSEQLQNAGITDIQALQTAVPNITIGTSFGYSNLFVRGLGLNSVFANVDPSVTMYEDGAIISQPAAQLFSFFDLERVEVLRGPQGTLYGRNSTGGQINLITAKPTATTEGFVQASIGNFGKVESEGAIGGALSEALQARLSYFVSSRGGFGKNIITGNDVNDYNSRAVRGQLRFAPARSDFEFLLQAEYGRENDAANALMFKRETYPGDPSLPSPGAGGFPDTGNPRDYASDVDPANNRETWSVTGTAKLDLGDHVSLTNILNYRKFKLDMTQDIDLSSNRTSSVQNFIFDSKQFSEEFQVNFTFDRLKAITGFYYFHENLYNQNAISIASKVGEFDPDTIGSGRRVFLTGNGTTESWALFWNADWEILPAVTLKAGGRFTTDKRIIDNENWTWVPSAAACPAPQSVVAGPFAPSTGGPARVQCYNSTLDDTRTFRKYTSEAGIEYRPASDLMLYYRYSEGFKAGTGQLGTTQTVLPLIVDPETVTSHEIGVKSRFRDIGLTANISAYTYTVKNIQLDRALVGGPTGFITIFENAPKQTGKGVEAEFIWELAQSFRTNLSIAWQKTRMGTFVTTDPLHPASPVDIKGNVARNAPEWAGSFHAEYDLPVGDGGLTLMGDASYKGRQYFSEFNNDVLQQPGYWLFDARLRYSFPGDRFSVAAWIKNIADERAETASYALATGRVIGRTFNEPRTFGISARYNY